MSKAKTWIPMGEGLLLLPGSKRPEKTICIEQLDFGIIGEWLSRTGEGMEQVDRICKAVSCHDDFVSACQRLILAGADTQAIAIAIVEIKGVVHRATGKEML